VRRRPKLIYVRTWPPQPPTESQFKILKLLGLRGPKNIYELSKETRIPFSTAHKSLGELSARDFVNLKFSGIQKGRRVKVFELTFSGLTVYISGTILTFAEMDLIVKHCAHLLPLFFDKWDYFKSVGLGKEVLEFLSGFAVVHWETFALGPSSDVDRDTLRLLWEFIEFVLKPFERTTERWLKAIRGDEELKWRAATTLKMEIKNHQDWIQILNEAHEVLEAPLSVSWEDLKKTRTALFPRDLDKRG
jgi:hypothetical protein